MLQRSLVCNYFVFKQTRSLRLLFSLTSLNCLNFQVVSNVSFLVISISSCACRNQDSILCRTKSYWQNCVLFALGLTVPRCTRKSCHGTWGINPPQHTHVPLVLPPCAANTSTRLVSQRQWRAGFGIALSLNLSTATSRWPGPGQAT